MPRLALPANYVVDFSTSQYWWHIYRPLQVGLCFLGSSQSRVIPGPALHELSITTQFSLQGSRPGSFPIYTCCCSSYTRASSVTLKCVELLQKTICRNQLCRRISYNCLTSVSYFLYRVFHLSLSLPIAQWWPTIVHDF